MFSGSILILIPVVETVRYEFTLVARRGGGMLSYEINTVTATTYY